jgi:hypothetical protein
MRSPYFVRDSGSPGKRATPTYQSLAGRNRCDHLPGPDGTCRRRETDLPCNLPNHLTEASAPGAGWRPAVKSACTLPAQAGTSHSWQRPTSGASSPTASARRPLDRRGAPVLMARYRRPSTTPSASPPGRPLTHEAGGQGPPRLTRRKTERRAFGAGGSMRLQTRWWLSPSVPDAAAMQHQSG